MPDLTISGLPQVGALTTIGDADELPIVSGGATKGISLSQLVEYVESRGRRNNASVANQTLNATDTYLVGSNCAIPQSPVSRLQAKTMYRCRFNVVKTAAGVAAPIIVLRIGTGGNSADFNAGTHTFAAQTAVVDEGIYELFATFRTVGASAVVQSVCHLSHRLTNTGLSVEDSPVRLATSAAFASTTPTNIGVSVVPGTSAAWTVSLVQAELFNLA